MVCSVTRLHRSLVPLIQNWQEVGCLINFFEWRDYPRNQPFIGPDKHLYKIEPNPLGNKEGNQEDLSKLLREADDLLFSNDTL